MVAVVGVTGEPLTVAESDESRGVGEFGRLPPGPAATPLRDGKVTLFRNLLAAQPLPDLARCGEGTEAAF